MVDGAHGNIMRILFIFPDVDSFHKLEIHFGIAYISGVLRTHGFKDIKFLSLTHSRDYGRIVQEVAEYNPDIVGFTSVETQFYNVINLSRLIKQKSKVLVVCGGTFPTIYPECVKEAEYLDGIFIGESEVAFLNFVKAVQQGKDFRLTENFCYYDKLTDSVVKNKLLPLETDLDRLGFPDREIFDFQNIIKHYGGIAPFMFNRGCPYNCTFCSNQAIASVYSKNSNTTRRRSVNSCITEIRQVSSKYSFNAVHIWDDLFTSDRSWLYEFLDKYKKEIDKPFMCTTRSNLCDDELFKKLKESGCYKVHMSLESGNDFIRNQIMKRNIPRDKVISSFALAKKYGIRINASSIIGLPFETESMIKETIVLLGSLKIEDVGVNIFYPYRGTQLREVCDQFGMIVKHTPYGIRERREGVLALPHISARRLEYYQRNFEELVRRQDSFGAYVVWKTKKIARAMINYVTNKKQEHNA
jgi:radical SAM superfamily enzyme YgiQ (UPF0313 family)